MPNHVKHFAIHADDVERARAFYESVFSWQFEAWGPPEFYLIDTGPGGVRGALQKRREPLPASGFHGFDCTIGVEDVDAIAGAIEEHGGSIVMAKLEIKTVGWLIQFLDTEGNRVGAMQYAA